MNNKLAFENELVNLLDVSSSHTTLRSSMRWAVKFAFPPCEVCDPVRILLLVSIVGCVKAPCPANFPVAETYLCVTLMWELRWTPESQATIESELTCSLFDLLMLLAVLLSCEKENSAPVPLPFQNHVTNAQLLCAHVHMRKIRLVLLKLPVLIALPAIPDQSGYLTICATRTNCASRTYLCYSQYLCNLHLAHRY